MNVCTKNRDDSEDENESVPEENTEIGVSATGEIMMGKIYEDPEGENDAQSPPAAVRTDVIIQGSQTDQSNSVPMSSNSGSGISIPSPRVSRQQQQGQSSKFEAFVKENAI